MYGEGVMDNRDRVIQHITDFRRDPDLLCRRAEAGLDVLASLPYVNCELAAVGYCFGGMAALELARQGSDSLVALAFTAHSTWSGLRSRDQFKRNFSSATARELCFLKTPTAFELLDLNPLVRFGYVTPDGAR
jgi:dienelactone hydrolase